MPRSIFGVSKLYCCFLGDLTSLSEISNTPLSPPETVLGYVYTAFHFCFQDLGHVYWFMLCFTALHFCWRWPHVSPAWSVTLSRSCSNACLAPVKHHSLNCSWWIFWPRVLLITHQTVQKWAQADYLHEGKLGLWQNSLCFKGQHINFSNLLSYSCNCKPFAQCNQANMPWKIMSWWKKTSHRISIREMELSAFRSQEEIKIFFRNQMILPFLSSPAAYQLLIELPWSQGFRESVPTDRPSNWYLNSSLSF